MKTKRFKQSNRVLGTGKDRIHGHVNNKGIFISMWKVSLLERLAILLMGTVWVKIDSKTMGHRPQVYHPFIGKMEYKRKNKRGFTPHGEL